MSYSQYKPTLLKLTPAYLLGFTRHVRGQILANRGQILCKISPNCTFNARGQKNGIANAYAAIRALSLTPQVYVYAGGETWKPYHEKKRD